MKLSNKQLKQQKRNPHPHHTTKRRILTGVGLTTLGLATMLTTPIHGVLAATNDDQVTTAQSTAKTVDSSQSVALNNAQSTAVGSDQTQTPAAEQTKTAVSTDASAVSSTTSDTSVQSNTASSSTQTTPNDQTVSDQTTADDKNDAAATDTKDTSDQIEVNVQIINDETDEVLGNYPASGKKGETIASSLGNYQNSLEAMGYTQVSETVSTTHFGDGQQPVIRIKPNNPVGQGQANVYLIDQSTGKTLTSYSVSGKTGEKVIDAIGDYQTALSALGYTQVSETMSSTVFGDNLHPATAYVYVTPSNPEGTGQANVYVVDPAGNILSTYTTNGKTGTPISDSLGDYQSALDALGLKQTGETITTTNFGDNHTPATGYIYVDSNYPVGTGQSIVRIFDETTGKVISTYTVTGKTGSYVSDALGDYSKALGALGYELVSENASSTKFGDNFHSVYTEIRIKSLVRPGTATPDISNPGYEHHDENGNNTGNEGNNNNNSGSNNQENGSNSNAGSESGYNSELNSSNSNNPVQNQVQTPANSVGKSANTNNVIPTTVLSQSALSTTSTTSTSSNGQGQLPKTGDDHAQTGILASVGDAILGLFGLAGIVKNRRRN